MSTISRTYSSAVAILSGPYLTLSCVAAPVTRAYSTGRMGGKITSITAASQTSAAVTGTMSGKVCQLFADAKSSATATGRITGNSCFLSANPTTYAAADGSMIGGVVLLSAESSTYCDASATLSGSLILLTASAETRATATATLSGASDLRGMSFCDVMDEVLAMWGIFCRKTAPGFAIDRATNDINSALQLVWNNAEGRSYWSNTTVTVTLDDGESSADLPDDIQNVVGPCRRSDNRRPLVPIGSIGELETFPDLYLDGDNTDEPVAYHVERTNQDGNDPEKCVFHVTPAVTGASVSFLLDVVKEAPRFGSINLVNCPLIPIPHRYVESLLLPVARYNASSFYLFRMGDQKPSIDREYQQAMISLGLADPINPKTGENKEKGGTDV